MRKYCVMDLETGGLEANIHAITSVAATVLDENLIEVETYYTLIKDMDNKLIEDKALEINGFTRKQLFENGKPIESVLRGLKRLMGNTIPVFHNARFDAGFLNARGMGISNAIDTMLIARNKHPGKKASLSFVAERFGFSSEGAHNALIDIMMTINILRKFSEDDKNVLIPRKIMF